MKNYLFLTLCLALISFAKMEEAKSSAPETDPAENISIAVCKNKCGSYDPKICDTLFKEYDICNAKKVESACSGFVLAFTNALPETVECTNTCDETPFKKSISFICDEMDRSGYPKITERSSHLLSKLKFKTAIDLFLSDKFYAILDGALAEDIIPKIEKHKKKK